MKYSIIKLQNKNLMKGSADYKFEAEYRFNLNSFATNKLNSIPVNFFILNWFREENQIIQVDKQSFYFDQKLGRFILDKRELQRLQKLKSIQKFIDLHKKWITALDDFNNYKSVIGAKYKSKNDIPVVLFEKKKKGSCKVKCLDCDCLVYAIFETKKIIQDEFASFQYFIYKFSVNQNTIGIKKYFILHAKMTQSFKPYQIKDPADYELIKSPSVKNIKVKIFTFKINDPHSFIPQISQLPSSQCFINRVHTHRDIERIDIEYPYTQPYFVRRKCIPGLHYSLAFQGGGAKGIAYVGAYRALLQNQFKGQKIPITSIMGSSAGGIIALAISTGIPPSDVQNLCFKMNQIPSQDKFTKISIEKKEEMLKKVGNLLHEYGIIHINVFQQLKRLIEKPQYEIIEQKILNILEALNPTFGEIFKSEVIQNNVKKTKFNLAGLLAQGALMKGTAIENIGAQCLTRYFFKRIYFQKQNISDLQAEMQYTFNNHKKNIIKIIELYSAAGSAMINRRISDFIELKNETKSQMLVTLINKTLILLNQILNQKHSFVDLRRINFNHLKGFNLESAIEEWLQLNAPENPNLQFQVDYELTKEVLKFDGLNQILNGVFLINSKSVSFSKAVSGVTVKHFLTQLIFKDPQYSKIMNQKEFEIYFYYLLYQILIEGTKMEKDMDELISKQARPQSIQVMREKQQSLIQNNKITEAYCQIFIRLRNIMKQITLLEYYKLTKIELTCTSVDLDDKILRFFNHKTTPNLPVCKAAQLTGSFPVGFKAQQWKQQWGKYLIHYRKTRRQIDLTGHQFTDGGLLANFPIKYLENQKMRPLYFSHISVGIQSNLNEVNRTVLLGFGLDRIQAKKEDITREQLQRDVERSERLSIHIADLEFTINKLLGPFGKIRQSAKLLFNIATTTGDSILWKEINHRKLLDQIPVVKYLIKIMKAYPNSDRNLNLEAFKNHIFVQNLNDFQFENQVKPAKIKVGTNLTISINDRDLLVRLFFEDTKIKSETKRIMRFHIKKYQLLIQKMGEEFNLKSSKDKIYDKDMIYEIKRRAISIILNKLQTRPKSQITKISKKFLLLRNNKVKITKDTLDESLDDNLQNLILQKQKINCLYERKQFEIIEQHLNQIEFKKKHYKNYTQNTLFKRQIITETQKQIQNQEIAYNQKKQIIQFLETLDQQDQNDFLEIQDLLITKSKHFLAQSIYLHKSLINFFALEKITLEEQGKLKLKLSQCQKFLSQKCFQQIIQNYLNREDIFRFYKLIFGEILFKDMQKQYFQKLFIKPIYQKQIIQQILNFEAITKNEAIDAQKTILLHVFGLRQSKIRKEDLSKVGISSIPFDQLETLLVQEYSRLVINQITHISDTSLDNSQFEVRFFREYELAVIEELVLYKLKSKIANKDLQKIYLLDLDSSKFFQSINSYKKVQQFESQKLLSNFQTLEQNMEVLLRTLKICLYSLYYYYSKEIQNTSFDNQQKIKFLSQVMVEVQSCIHTIYIDLLERLKVFAQLPIDSCNDQNLSLSYLIKFSVIETIVQKIYLPISEKCMQSNDQCYHELWNIINKISQNKINLPLYSVDWTICLLACRPKFYQQFLPNLFVYKNRQKNKNIHLVLEGVYNSNEYFAGFYTLIIKQGHEHTIKAITTTGFQSVFGFLLSLGLGLEKIRQEMYKIQNIAINFQESANNQKVFEQMKWLKTNDQDMKDFYTYLNEEKYDIFKQLQRLANRNTTKLDLKFQLQKIIGLYENNKERILRYHEQMIEEITQSIHEIDSTYTARKKALEISKRYSLNYVCNRGKIHAYEKYNQMEIQEFEQLMRKIFETFGSLYEGIITNFIANYSGVILELSRETASKIFKGVVVKRLLTSYKMKEYVINKLKQLKMSPSISLGQFFKISPRKIFLNFTTINIDLARIEFMNKNTVPNMPVWAAIVSATSLPFFYRYFKANKQWSEKGSESGSFYSILVDYFFNNAVQKQGRFIRYAAGNFISSLPMQLLTNETALNKMFNDRDTNESKNEPKCIHFGIAFNMREQGFQFGDIILKRQYFNFSIVSQLFRYMVLRSKNLRDHNLDKNACFLDVHNNNQYLPIGILRQKISKMFQSGYSNKYFSILLESNDNFTLYTYWDRLVRLPIKIGTLDFHDIVDSNYRERYFVNLPSEKSKQTIERSYEITKYFTRSFCLQNPQSAKVDRRIKLKVQIIQKSSHLFQENAKYAKIQILSHSKWNRNKYNNFVIEYWYDSGTNKMEPQRAIQSEIVWPIIKANRVYVKFYYPRVDINFPEKDRVLFTLYEFDISEFIEELPKRDSYEYEFDYSPRLNEQKQFLKALTRNRYAIEKQFAPRLLFTWKHQNIEYFTNQIEHFIIEDNHTLTSS